MRILLVSQFWPSEGDPALGIFVQRMTEELERRGHTIARAVVDHRGGPPTKHVGLLADALREARRVRPDVVYAHFLAPAGVVGAAASLAARVPLVVTAHGQDVRNVAEVSGMRALTSLATRRATTVIAVSAFLRDSLAESLPGAAAKAEVIDMGVDLDRFAPADQARARRDLGLGDVTGPLLLFAGALSERKNVDTLARAVAPLRDVTLVALGDGPLRPDLEALPNARLVGAVPHDRVARYVAAADVLVLPSLVEPFGQVLLEAMAGERSVVATRTGGPPEFVPPEAGVLVDPNDPADIREGILRALRLPSPNPAARAAAARHDLRLQAERVEQVLARAIARHVARGRGRQ